MELFYVLAVIIFIIIAENGTNWLFKSKKEYNPFISVFENNFEIQADPSGDTLYYIRFKFKDVYYYKVGITKNSTDKRFQHGDRKYLDRVLFAKRIQNAPEKEQEILKHFESDKFPIKLTKSGYTEMFNRDILELDKSV